MPERPWWQYLLGAVIIGAIGAGVGYAIGAPSREDAERIRKRNEREGLLKSKKVVVPTAALDKTETGRILYAEAVGGYLSSIPNGAFDNIMKVLEITLRKKYEEMTNKPTPTHLPLENLIDAAEKYLKDSKDLAQSFRIKRKNIHFDKQTSELYTLDAIFHISNMLNLVYPYESTVCFYACPACHMQERINVRKEDNYLGNVLNLRCANNNQASISVVINQ